MSDTLVWIDAREAIIVQRSEDRAKLERVVSDVPAHHRSTGHVRHDPTVRHGGGGPQSAGEPKRIEHLERFIGQVADHLSPDDDLLILGPGTVHEHLERLIRDRDTHHARSRRITCRASSRLTDRQLIAQLSRFSGHEPRRTHRRRVPLDRAGTASVHRTAAATTAAGRREAPSTLRAGRRVATWQPTSCGTRQEAEGHCPTAEPDRSV